MQARWLVMAAAAAAAAVGIAGGAMGGQRKLPRVRIGVYDNRAVAIAYTFSPYSPMRQRMDDYRAAKQAGHTDRVKELEAWGKSQQRLMHFKGFGRVPVTDLLDPIRPQLARMAQAQRLAAIAMECDFTGKDVETVDVTGAIVELYHPDDQTRKAVAGIKGVRPVGLLELADMPASE